MTLQQSASMAVKKSHWGDMIGEEEGDSASIQLWWVPAAAGPTWVNGDTKKFLAAVMARQTVDLHGGQ